MIIPINRAQRRVHAVTRRRVHRAEAQHVCRVRVSSEANGVKGEVPVGLLFYHDLHRIFGEPSCPFCPRCLMLAHAGRLDRAPSDPAGTLAKWQQTLKASLECQQGP